MNALFARLADERPESRSVPIEGDPLRLALVVDAAIAASPDGPGENPEPQVMPPDWRGIDVTLLLEDADGRLHKVTGGPGSDDRRRPADRDSADARRRRPASVSFPGPARLQGVELSFRMPPEMVGDRDDRHPRRRGQRLRIR